VLGTNEYINKGWRESTGTVDKRQRVRLENALKRLLNTRTKEFLIAESGLADGKMKRKEIFPQGHFCFLTIQNTRTNKTFI